MAKVTSSGGGTPPWWFASDRSLVRIRRASNRSRFLRLGAIVVTGILIGTVADVVMAGRAGLSPSSSAPAVAVGSAPPSGGAPTPSAGPSGSPTAGDRPGPARYGPPLWPTADDIAVAASTTNVVFRVKTSRKVVALTFDDGWSPVEGHRILSILRTSHVAATFFINATYVHRDPDLWKAVAKDGFPIGNHTFDHRSFLRMTPIEIAADLLKDARVFQKETGYTLAPLVRPPYGDRSRLTDAVAAAAGFPNIILWNVVAGDTDLHPTLHQEIVDATRGGPGSIVLMHVGPVSTPAVLKAVIASYRKRGYQFVTIPELLALQ